MSDSKDKDLEETKRIMSRLVKMPHKDHEDMKLGKRKPLKKKAAKKRKPKDAG